MLLCSIRRAPELTQHRVADALAFVRDFQAVAEQATKSWRKANSQHDFARDRYRALRCHPHGTGVEQEPMFLGSAANHAAKLGRVQPGVFLSDRVRALLASRGLASRIHSKCRRGRYQIRSSHDAMKAPRRLQWSQLSPETRGHSRSLRDDISKTEVPDATIPRFSFRHKEPPLSEIDYADLSPSNSIRMPLISLFADLSGYTHYIDSGIAAVIHLGSNTGVVRNSRGTTERHLRRTLTAAKFDLLAIASTRY